MARLGGRGPTAAEAVKKKARKGPIAKASSSPAVRFADFRADLGERLAVARAKVAEKAANAHTSMRVMLVKLRHPVHPVRRVAAKEAAREAKAAATERRKQAIARARTIAAQKKAVVRERRARELNESVVA